MYTLQLAEALIITFGLTVNILFLINMLQLCSPWVLTHSY